MRQTYCIRTALLGLAVALTFGMGFTSCKNEPSDLIVGTWTLSTVDSYYNDVLGTIFDIDNHVIKYYDNDGKVVDTDSIGDYKLTYTFKDDKTVYYMLSADGDSESGNFTYSIETVNGEQRLQLTDEGETIDYIISTLTKNELVFSYIETDEDDTGKIIYHFKK